MPAHYTLRQARPEDAAAIVTLIRHLAAFEEPEAVLGLSEASVRRDAFGPAPRFEALLGETVEAIAGLATLVPSYSSWAGAPALLLHDLFVEDWARGRGLGRALVTAAAGLAVARGCCRLDVNVLTWNETARSFYEALGFAPLTDWVPHRLGTTGLSRLARPL